MRLLSFLLVLLIWLVTLCLHEFAHARVAFAGGDTTVRAKGYLSLNPFRYMDPMQSILFPLLIVLIGGIGLPGGAVWIETWRLRSRAWISGVSLAGPATNALLCAVFGLPFLLGADRGAGGGEIWAILAISSFLQATAALLNLLPLPGLDGYGALAPWLPRKLDSELRQYGRYSMILMIVLFWGLPGFSRWFFGMTSAALRAFHVPHEALNQGFDILNVLGLRS